ncbi:hypothetical protein EW026_g4355 [Hermanssonia centrifuga]|uniref:Phospholipase A-2-activating protein n=1 Tax=Hermanssonia centrifuga TaxID=98765 RepID=A0A4S4KIJ0_9APHY|nr:hypothetical protein EW026_g4355 [Hermanssonia centrifuga]
MNYKLSATLSAHTSDVRAVASPDDSLILSASRDTTAITWSRPSPTAPFAQATVLRAGTRFISAITYIPPRPDAPEGYVVTGGQDAVINIFSLATHKEEPNFSLVGHTQNVCSLDAAPDGTVISGSWDQTAKIWKNFELAYDLVGHSQSVWAVLAIDPERFLTGSADNTIKLWYQHKNVKTFTGHTQAVRGLALIPDIGFASCSNDSISVLPSGDIVSGGEDRTLRIWRDGECAQVITHPAISVWTVSTMPNADIVTGCSDGVVRVFSASEERWAPANELKAYEDSVASTALPAQQVGDVKKSDLPGIEALSQPGKKAGEVKMIRNAESVEAHEWDSVNFSWKKIGDVVDAVGSGRKQLYQGKEYDYVFDVDVEEGSPPLKLPYNANENPYTAAQRFLDNHELPHSYLDEVVRFIEKNTAGVNIGSGGGEFVDPFTGASRYQASQTTSTGGSQDYMDPFTEWNEPWSSPLPKSRDTNVLLLLRGLANAFQDDTTLDNGAWAGHILKKLGEAPYTVLSKNQRVALGTILFNLSCVGLRENLDSGLRTLHVTLILSILQAETSDSEAAYRSLVALGNTVYAAKQASKPLEASQAATAKQVLAHLPSVFLEDRIRNMASVISGML